MGSLLRIAALAAMFSLGMALGGEVGGACDFKRPEIRRLLEVTKLFYGTGEFDYEASDLVSKVLIAREAVLTFCTAALLQAFLLKVEECMVRDPEAYETILTAYEDHKQSGLERGLLAAGDFDVWPLAKGLKRVQDQHKKLQEKPGATSAMVMNFCQTVDRFGNAHELEWLLLPPFGNAADAALFGGAEMGLLSETDLFIYLVDKPKCRWPGDRLTEQLSRAVRSVSVVPYQGGPEREEQTAYFKFLADHYDNLPDFAIFVHPDAPEHQGPEFAALARALRLIRTGSALAHEAIRYFPVAQQIVVEPRRTWGARYAHHWAHFWDALYDRPWQSYNFGPPRCEWVLEEGKFLVHLAPGAQTGQQRHVAKAQCLAAGDKCVGVTCGTREAALEERHLASVYEEANPALPQIFVASENADGTCSARMGDGLLYASPTGEKTYLKHCSEPGSSPFPDAVFDVEAELGPVASGPQYVELEGAFLPGYAADDDTVRNLRQSRDRCEELGDRCAGVTCNKWNVECTVRESAEVFDSPYEEVSHLKRPAGSWRPRQYGWSPHPAPARGEGPFQLYTGSQSVVHKDRIRAWPRSKLAALSADGDFCSTHTGNFEAVWHAMFGEPLSQPAREKDPRLPLYFKWGAVKTVYSFGDEGVI